MFDFPTLLMALVSSVALLAVAKTVVEVLAFHVLPLKKVYRSVLRPCLCVCTVRRV